VTPWLQDTFAALAETAGIDAGAVPFSDADADVLLGIARIASHDSEDRTNAPLLCYLIGRLMERAPESSLDEMRALVAGRAREQA